MTERHNRAAIDQALVSFSHGQRAKIKKAANYFEKKSGVPADDLISSASLRLLKRSCRKDQEILLALIGMIRSVASIEMRSARNREFYADPADIDKRADDIRNQEEILIRKSIFKRFSQLAAAEFEKKPVLQKLFNGRVLGLKGKALQKYVGLNDKAMESNLKTFNRALSHLRKLV